MNYVQNKQSYSFDSFFLQGLQAIRCPAGLAFDIEKQTCDWKAAVSNCEAKTKEKKVKPLLFTDEPICQENYLACGDGNCIERGLFCNGEKDCNDGSDENACGKFGGGSTPIFKKNVLPFLTKNKKHLYFFQLIKKSVNNFTIGAF